MTQLGNPALPILSKLLDRQMLFVSGKGGVGKTSISRAIAMGYARHGLKTLWVAFEDPLKKPGELIEAEPNLWLLNCVGTVAFEEYTGLKIGIPSLTRLFVRNRLIQTLAQGAPGIHEIVLLGKVWHELANYQKIVLDMPSTGFGLAMFHSVLNFQQLFKGGPIQRDAEKMMKTFRDPNICGNLIVSLPEEMPLRESLDLAGLLAEVLPGTGPGFLVNRVYPEIAPLVPEHQSPFPQSAFDYLCHRSQLEKINLKIWDDLKIPYLTLGAVEPPVHLDPLNPSLTLEQSSIIEQLYEKLKAAQLFGAEPGGH